MKSFIPWIIFLVSFSSFVLEDVQHVYTLGRIEVVGPDEMAISEQETNTVQQDSFERHNLMNVSQATSLLSGVNIAGSGSRNEKTVLVRGFDLRQVPLFLDGIPVYVPYDQFSFIINKIVFRSSKRRQAASLSSFIIWTT